MRQPKSSKSRKPLVTEGLEGPGGRWCLKARKQQNYGRAAVWEIAPEVGSVWKGFGTTSEETQPLSEILPEAEQEGRKSLVSPLFQGSIFYQCHPMAKSTWEPTDKGTSKMCSSVYCTEWGSGDGFEGHVQITGTVSHSPSEPLHSPLSNLKAMSF